MDASDLGGVRKLIGGLLEEARLEERRAVDGRTRSYHQGQVSALQGVLEKLGGAHRYRLTDEQYHRALDEVGEARRQMQELNEERRERQEKERQRRQRLS